MKTIHTPPVAKITNEQATALRDAIMGIVPNFAPRKNDKTFGIANYAHMCHAVAFTLSYLGLQNSAHMWVHFDFDAGKLTISQFTDKHDYSVKVSKLTFRLGEDGDIAGVVNNSRIVTALQNCANAIEGEYMVKKVVTL